MAIKVNGTTVIDDSRNLSNIAGGLKTVNSTSLLGSGNIEAGASTTYGAVGTYIIAAVPQNINSNSTINGGDTQAGSTMRYTSTSSYFFQVEPLLDYSTISASASLSGTWRLMCPLSKQANTTTTYYMNGLYVRIS